MKVYAYLLDTKCILSDDETAIIAVNSEDGLKKVVLSRNDSLEIISEAIFNVLGRKLNVKVKDEKELGQIKQKSDEDPVFEKVKQFAIENDIHLEVRE
jgi:peptidyl-tRNA hydrolase